MYAATIIGVLLLLMLLKLYAVMATSDYLPKITSPTAAIELQVAPLLPYFHRPYVALYYHSYKCIYHNVDSWYHRVITQNQSIRN